MRLWPGFNKHQSRKIRSEHQEHDVPKVFNVHVRSGDELAADFIRNWQKQREGSENKDLTQFSKKKNRNQLWN